MNKQLPSMPYNRLGSSGLQVSQFSFGSWVTFGGSVDTGIAKEQLQAAADAGVNFFDNAEVYAGGKSEEIMGEAIRELGWKRHEYVISTKLFWGINGDMPNMKNTLNRKYLMQGIDGSLERLGLDFVDLLYCHRPDKNTPIEETVWAMSDIVASGKALYWGTSEWSADEIRAAWLIADKYGLRKPVMEQPQYNLLHRDRVENEYARLYNDVGLGLTTWSPLAGGILTGKYLDGVPEGSRATLKGHDYLTEAASSSADQVRELAKIAGDLGVTTAQLALAWIAANPHVSTVILGVSSVSQLHENLGALYALEQLTPELKTNIDNLFA
ncbi:potassium channel beta subunit family protein [Arcanobacterium ihumii]|uniref:potassium channel beta subunit family protein n=1 Tax=Arcanobacterium ihumii TaxID=2138162 RepID=UPI00190F5B85|nr:aldo/keto reductase [Arcanobacterium ihumii]